MPNNMDSFRRVFVQAYQALKNEEQYYERLAETSILEEDRVRFFRAAIALQRTLAEMESAQQAAVDAFAGSPLKGPDDATLAHAEQLATEFATKIAATAKAQSVVTIAAKFLDAWSRIGGAVPA